MQHLVWKTLSATGVTDAAKAATESLVSMAARQLTEAATAELERRWAAAAGSGPGSRKRPAPARHPRRGSGAGKPGMSPRPGRAASAARDGSACDEDSIRRLRAAIAALDASIDTLGAR